MQTSREDSCFPPGGVGRPELEGILEGQAGELCSGALAEENRGARVGLGSGPRCVEARGRAASAHRSGQSRGGEVGGDLSASVDVWT